MRLIRFKEYYGGCPYPIDDVQDVIDVRYFPFFVSSKEIALIVNNRPSDPFRKKGPFPGLIAIYHKEE